MEIIWKPQARKDLEAIEEYYLKVAPKFGDVFVDKVLEAVQQLERFPQSGRKIPEINDPDFREIIYFVASDRETVEILTVFHSARQF
ncbi:MAG TPA: type II toxin-antitoxin system RelE/ParE family toxin [Balneolaceae bacterium]|nr:type II toxin-antitoxin system RelE/ParE family toxin [Balneolaceae bacterium]